MILCAVFPFSHCSIRLNRHLRRYRQQQMYMIFRHMSLHDLDVVFPADLSHQISYPQRHLSRQHRLAVLRCPYHVQMNLVYGVRAASILFHLYKLNPRRS